MRSLLAGGLAYRDLEDELLAIVDGLKGVENGGELLGIELDCRRLSAACDRELPDGARFETAELLTIDDGTCGWIARLAKSGNNFPGRVGRALGVGAGASARVEAYR
jgi:hypothetical protein